MRTQQIPADLHRHQTPTAALYDVPAVPTVTGMLSGCTMLVLFLHKQQRYSWYQPAILNCRYSKGLLF